MAERYNDNICLYRMTHINNIPHILRCGIVHKRSPLSNPNYVPIGDRSLIDTRTSKIVQVHQQNITLGDYIPFYFGVRMPMLYVIQHGGNFVPRPVPPEDIIYVVVSLASVFLSGQNFYFSDGHAIDSLTKFYSNDDIKNLPSIIDWSAVQAIQWTEPTIKRKKQAECLIEGDVSVTHIIAYVCYNANAKKRLMQMGVPEEIIKIYPKAYY